MNTSNISISNNTTDGINITNNTTNATAMTDEMGISTVFNQILDKLSFVDYQIPNLEQMAYNYILSIGLDPFHVVFNVLALVLILASMYHLFITAISKGGGAFKFLIYIVAAAVVLIALQVL